MNTPQNEPPALAVTAGTGANLEDTGNLPPSAEACKPGSGDVATDEGGPAAGIMPRTQCGGFIALRRSRDLLDLLQHDPNAFLLLTLIAVRCRWNAQAANWHGLEIGEAAVGDFESCGLTREKYRLALARLARYEIIKTTKTTKRGTVVKLLSTEIYNPFLGDGNHQTNQKPTIRQPSGNHQATTNQYGGEDGATSLRHTGLKKSQPAAVAAGGDAPPPAPVAEKEKPATGYRPPAFVEVHR